MAEETGISWTDATFNPWMGCTKVGPGCDHCYAEKLVDSRMHRAKWGVGEPRTRTSHSNWEKVQAWNRHPEKLIGRQWPARKPRVFAASLADIFDNEIDPQWRDDFWDLVSKTENLQWLIVTKRISNVFDMLPADFGAELERGKYCYSNIVLIITVVNQAEANRDITRLLRIKAHFPWLKVGLSIEPMLGPISGIVKPQGGPSIDWVICGGESGADARPMPKAWALSLRDQCVAAGVPFHFKQWGEWHPNDEAFASGMYGLKNDTGETKIGKHRAGRYLDGVEHNGFPA